MSQPRYASRLNRTAQFPLGVFPGGGSKPQGMARWSTFDAGLKVSAIAVGPPPGCPQGVEHSRLLGDPVPTAAHPLASYLRQVGSCHRSCHSSSVTPGFPKVSLERF